jgi:hypothetical protein
MIDQRCCRCGVVQELAFRPSFSDVIRGQEEIEPINQPSISLSHQTYSWQPAENERNEK